jgi:hypothetical protein
VTASQEVASKTLEVVDLAVADGVHGPIFIRDRLVAISDVDDRQAAHAEQGTRVAVSSSVIRAAVRDSISHSRQPRLVDGLTFA